MLRSALSPRHVPDEMHQVPGVPRTLSGKKLEVPVRKILTGTPVDEAADRDSLANPEVLAYYVPPEVAPAELASSVTAPVGRSFGEEGGRLTYGTYLHLADLLAQQVPLAEPPAHDELLFITVHQVYELWFKQLLHELAAARDAMDADRDLAARRHLMQRAQVIERLLVAQIDVIETMTPQDFLQFRSTLAPASGLQSVQFRELEFLSGAKDHRFVARFRNLTADERERLSRRLAEPVAVGRLPRPARPPGPRRELGRAGDSSHC